MTHNQISGIIVDTSLAIRRALGPGLLESVYCRILAHELRKRGLKVEAEVPIPVIWDNVIIESAFRADLIVEDLVLVELKSVEQNSPVHRKQLLTYLNLTDKRLGLLINFGLERLTDGIARLVNGLNE